MMRFDILTLFPDICRIPLSQSILGRACKNKLIEINVHDIRDWTTDKHRTVDDLPFGGGVGMVMKPEPLFAAVQSLRQPESRVLMLTPQGRSFTQSSAGRLASESHLILLCGHYEGVDHRVVEALVDEEWSIGDYVLTNGAIAANVVVDAIARLIPGVLGDARSSVDESFANGLLEAPHYTRPANFQGMEVPPVLLSGHHAEIERWRKEQAQQRTQQNRPDLWEKWQQDTSGHQDD